MTVKRRISKTKKRQQRGGVGYSLDVTKKNCKIGGLPEVVATSDCPSLGPGDPGFAQALYGGSRKSKRVKKSKSRSKSKKTKRVKKSKRGY